MASRASADRLVRDVAQVCARAQDPLVLLERVAALVRSRVPYAAAGWILVDPETLLLNGVYAEEVDRTAHLALIEAEQSDVEDVNRFVDLVRDGRAAATLAAATGGDLSRSPRWRDVYRPRGYGDELRAVFANGAVAWGHACLTRTADDPWFATEEVDLVARVCPHVAHGIRTGLVVSGEGSSGVEAPALVVLHDDGSVESMTPAVADWFGDPEDESLRTTIVLHEVARRARALAEGQGDARPARAWARTRSGDSIVVRGARLAGHGRTALVLDRADRADVAPLLVQLQELTDRERQVTQLLLTGRSTRDIAGDLWISPETLRGHVKSVFAKLQVSSRAELFALLSREPRFRTRPAGRGGRRIP